MLFFIVTLGTVGESLLNLKMPAMKTVKDILIKKPYHAVSVDLNEKVIEAVAIMAREDTNYVVVEHEGDYAGLFSEKEYTRKIILAGKDHGTTTVGEIMRVDIPIVDACDSTDTCTELMHAFKIAFLPVFEDFRFIGVITLHDLLKDNVNEHLHSFEAKTSKHKERNNDNIPHYWV